MDRKKPLTSFTLIVVMGLTQWLISHNIYDPNQPDGKPTTTQTQSQPTGGCNG